MQVNRLSLRLQGELKEATNYNDKRTEDVLFTNQTQQPTPVKQPADFGQTDLSDLPITPAIIGNLLSSFADEIISIFGSDIPSLPSEPAPENNPNERVTASTGTYVLA